MQEAFESTGGVIYNERRVRLIHATNSSMEIGLHTQFRDQRFECRGLVNDQDTVIEESRTSDIPHTIRIAKMTPFGAQQILEDAIYGKNLRKITFGCPISLDFVQKILMKATLLEAVRFGHHAFHLVEEDKDTEENSIDPRNLNAKEVTFLEMAFDDIKYGQYDDESKEIMGRKFSTILQVASSSFPKLRECDILVPEQIGPDLDLFLSKMKNVKCNGWKTINYVTHTVQFITQRFVRKSKQVKKQRIPEVRKDVGVKSSLATKEVIVVDISDDSEEIPVFRKPSTRKTSKVSERATKENPSVHRLQSSDLAAVDVVEEWGHTAFVPDHVTCCKCGCRSKNFHCCEGCGHKFPSKIILKDVKDSAIAPSILSTNSSTSTDTVGMTKYEERPFSAPQSKTRPQPVNKHGTADIRIDSRNSTGVGLNRGSTNQTSKRDWYETVTIEDDKQATSSKRIKWN